MLTPPYFQKDPDDAMMWAQLAEWTLREEAYRKAHPDEVPAEVSLAQLVPARDAGDVCGVCGELVTWVDHLPPAAAGGAVRCMKNVVSMPVIIDDIFPRV